MWSSRSIVSVHRSDHRQVVAVLARELGISADEVDIAYRRELERLGSEARIQDFIPLLAACKVRSAFRRKASQSAKRRFGNGTQTSDEQRGWLPFAEAGPEDAAAPSLSSKLGWRLPTLNLFLMSERRPANDEPEPNEDERSVVAQ
jgi:hypothetical protein